MAYWIQIPAKNVHLNQSFTALPGSPCRSSREERERPTGTCGWEVRLECDTDCYCTSLRLVFYSGYPSHSHSRSLVGIFPQLPDNSRAQQEKFYYPCDYILAFTKNKVAFVAFSRAWSKCLLSSAWHRSSPQISNARKKRNKIKAYPSHVKWISNDFY